MGETRRRKRKRKRKRERERERERIIVHKSNRTKATQPDAGDQILI